jgi:MYXO-CTERM domain-containing protein
LCKSGRAANRNGAIPAILFIAFALRWWPKENRGDDMMVKSVFCRLVVPLIAFSICLGFPSVAGGVSARWAYEDAYDNVNGGDWYRDSDNETATLAWGESYVMMSIAALYRATGDPVYLDRLAWHVDGVLANRDDARGVTDYRGVSGACWQNQHYQPANEPYCYVVHTGMLTWPMVEYARLVYAQGLESEVAPDGETYGAKAGRYVVAAEQSVAYHDDQWSASGYYFFRSDAAFLSFPGTDLPLNQSNALGRTLLALYELTSTPAYLDKATALAIRFRNQCTTAADGALLWNYWGGTYSGDGEDISHAALNVGFAVMAQQHGVGFSSADVDAMAATFTERIYVDDATFSDHVGGGAVNGSSYRPQVGRWVVLTPRRSTVYTAVRDLYERDYAASGVGSGSLLYGWALLAEFELPLCVHFFYSVDWDDQGPHREATAYGANLLTEPPALTSGCMIPLQVDVPRQTVTAQWDGSSYHRVAEWQPTSGFVLRRFGYETAWPFVYSQNGVLFQFEDTFVAGDGILVMEPGPFVTPTIDSNPPTTLEVGQTLAYAATGSGDAPLWWSLDVFPPGARVDAATGAVTWTTVEPGAVNFVLRLENDWGTDEPRFWVNVTDPPGPDAGPDDGGSPDSAVVGDADAPGDDAASELDATPDADTSEPDAAGGGCNCQSGGGRSNGPTPPWAILPLLLLGWWVRRRKV